MIFFVFGALIWNKVNPIDYQIYEADAIQYNKGVVTEVVEESLEQVPEDKNRYLGVQIITVNMKNGTFEGEELEIENNLSTTHNIYVKKGQHVIIKVDSPEGVQPYFSLYNYDRTPGFVLIISIFILLMGIVGRQKGIKSVISLAFTVVIIGVFLLPMIYHGYSPIVCCIITIIFTASISMILLNGYGKKTLIAILSTGIGVFVAAIVFSLFSELLHLTGYNLEEAEELILISQNTGLKTGELLFAGLLISSLGAVMDMTVSVASSLFEIKQIHPAMSLRAIFSSGMNIGKDMIGTMSATLILAFTGTAITTLLVLISYGASIDQLLSSDYFTIEVAHAITGSIAIIFTVPITALISAYLLCKQN